MEGEVRDILSEITAYVAMRYVTEESPESIKDEERLQRTMWEEEFASGAAPVSNAPPTAFVRPRSLRKGLRNGTSCIRTGNNFIAQDTYQGRNGCGGDRVQEAPGNDSGTRRGDRSSFPDNRLSPGGGADLHSLSNNRHHRYRHRYRYRHRDRQHNHNHRRQRQEQKLRQTHLLSPSQERLIRAHIGSATFLFDNALEHRRGGSGAFDREGSIGLRHSPPGEGDSHVPSTCRKREGHLHQGAYSGFSSDDIQCGGDRSIGRWGRDGCLANSSSGPFKLCAVNPTANEYGKQHLNSDMHSTGNDSAIPPFANAPSTVSSCERQPFQLCTDSVAADMGVKRDGAMKGNKLDNIARSMSMAKPDTREPLGLGPEVCPSQNNGNQDLPFTGLNSINFSAAAWSGPGKRRKNWRERNNGGDATSSVISRNRLGVSRTTFNSGNGTAGNRSDGSWQQRRPSDEGGEGHGTDEYLVDSDPESRRLLESAEGTVGGTKVSRSYRHQLVSRTKDSHAPWPGILGNSRGHTGDEDSPVREPTGACFQSGFRQVSDSHRDCSDRASDQDAKAAARTSGNYMGDGKKNGNSTFRNGSLSTTARIRPGSPSLQKKMLATSSAVSLTSNVSSESTSFFSSASLSSGRELHGAEQHADHANGHRQERGITVKTSDDRDQSDDLGDQQFRDQHQEGLIPDGEEERSFVQTIYPEKVTAISKDVHYDAQQEDWCRPCEVCRADTDMPSRQILEGSDRMMLQSGNRQNGAYATNGIWEARDIADAPGKGKVAEAVEVGTTALINIKDGENSGRRCRHDRESDSDQETESLAESVVVRDCITRLIKAERGMNDGWTRSERHACRLSASTLRPVQRSIIGQGDECVGKRKVDSSVPGGKSRVNHNSNLWKTSAQQSIVGGDTGDRTTPMTFSALHTAAIAECLTEPATLSDGSGGYIRNADECDTRRKLEDDFTCDEEGHDKTRSRTSVGVDPAFDAFSVPVQLCTPGLVSVVSSSRHPPWVRRQGKDRQRQDQWRPPQPRLQQEHQLKLRQPQYRREKETMQLAKRLKQLVQLEAATIQWERLPRRDRERLDRQQQIMSSRFRVTEQPRRQSLPLPGAAPTLALTPPSSFCPNRHCSLGNGGSGDGNGGGAGGGVKPTRNSANSTMTRSRSYGSDCDKNRIWPPSDAAISSSIDRPTTIYSGVHIVPVCATCAGKGPKAESWIIDVGDDSGFWDQRARLHPRHHRGSAGGAWYSPREVRTTSQQRLRNETGCIGGVGGSVCGSGGSRNGGNTGGSRVKSRHDGSSHGKAVSGLRDADIASSVLRRGYLGDPSLVVIGTGSSTLPDEYCQMNGQRLS